MLLLLVVGKAVVGEMRMVMGIEGGVRRWLLRVVHSAKGAISRHLLYVQGYIKNGAKKINRVR